MTTSAAVLPALRTRQSRGWVVLLLAMFQALAAVIAATGAALLIPLPRPAGRVRTPSSHG